MVNLSLFCMAYNPRAKALVLKKEYWRGYFYVFVNQGDNTDKAVGEN